METLRTNGHPFAAGAGRPSLTGWSRRLLMLLTLAALALTLQACGDEVIDNRKVAIAVKYDIQSATGIKVEKVTCPDSIVVRTGNRFACRVTTADGRRAFAELKVLNESADLRLIELVGR